ncbi:TetR/AcrR family transcriptional regulator [Acidovorax sp. LjRoot129]|uniref:TetR/AcrR family transcriptional regulator n=1 Tax=Acidovorax sp. LjRoot129 TaxID=3342260 RepID=UPI003ECC311A
MPPAPPAPRRTPRQERSQFTVDAIFGAVARIVETEGEAGLTTNRIAETAGVSVGSLYQYFPSKEAILAAMLDQHCDRVMLELDALLAQARAEGWTPEQQVRRYARHYLQAFGAGPPAGRALARLSWQLDYRTSMLVSVRGTSERLALHLQRMAEDHHLPAPTPAQLFVLTRAFMGAVRAASLEQSPLLDSPEFEQALVALCLAYLAPGMGLQGTATIAP